MDGYVGLYVVLRSKRDKSVYFRSWGCSLPYNAIIIRTHRKNKMSARKAAVRHRILSKARSNYYACDILRSLHYVDTFCC